jgi:putative nucleotidyltransferase with HDIG domain
MEEKARAIFQNAHHLVVHAMRQPHLGQSLEYGREYINNVVGFVRKNPSCLKQLHEVLAMDYSLFNHSVNVCLLLISFAHHRNLNSGQMIFLGLGGLFHDIGKREIPERILNKPGPLTPEEWDEMRRHPAKGVELLREAGHLPPETFQIVYQHHENLDGSGYPRGLPGEKITVPGRLIRIVDAYDALTSRRCYQDAVPATTALTVMAKEMQNLLDQELLGSFIKFLGMVTKH